LLWWKEKEKDIVSESTAQLGVTNKAHAPVYSYLCAFPHILYTHTHTRAHIQIRIRIKLKIETNRQKTIRQRNSTIYIW